VSCGKGHDKRIWPRHRIFGLRRRCPETRVVLLHPSPNTAPIVSGVFFLLWLAGVLGRGLKASMHRNYDREACALILHRSPSASYGYTPRRSKRRSYHQNGTAPPSHCHYSATVCQFCSVRRSRRFIEALSWICGYCPVAHTHAFAVLHGTHPIYSHIASQLPCRSSMWALVQFNLGTFVRFLRFLLLLPLDQTGSPIYCTLWHILSYLCNIPPLHFFLPFSLVTAPGKDTYGSYRPRCRHRNRHERNFRSYLLPPLAFAPPTVIIAHLVSQNCTIE